MRYVIEGPGVNRPDPVKTAVALLEKRGVEATASGDVVICDEQLDRVGPFWFVPVGDPS